MKQASDEPVVRTLTGYDALRYAQQENLGLELLDEQLPKSLKRTILPKLEGVDPYDTTVPEADALIRSGVPPELLVLYIGVSPGHEEAQVIRYLEGQFNDPEDEWVLVELIFHNSAIRLSATVLFTAIMRLMAKEVLETREPITAGLRWDDVREHCVRFCNPLDAPLPDHLAKETIVELQRLLGSHDGQNVEIPADRKRWYHRALHSRLRRAS